MTIALRQRPLARVVQGIVQAAAGCWLDPSDMTTMYQDAAGTTPVTAVEQPVGKILDKSGKGNHATQSITASRPVLSARYNLLTKTEDFSDAVWLETFAIINNEGIYNGSNYFKLTNSSATTTASYVRATTTKSSTTPYSNEVYVKKGNTDYVFVRDLSVSDIAAFFNLNTGLFETVGAGLTATAVSMGDGWYKLSVSSTPASITSNLLDFGPATIDANRVSAPGSFVYLCKPQVTVGSKSMPYQRVNTATDYDTDERHFPKYLRFDGIDDYLSLPYMGLYANGSASIITGRDDLSQAIDTYIISERSTASISPKYFPLRQLASGGNMDAYITGDAGTVVLDTTGSVFGGASNAVVRSVVDAWNNIKLFKNGAVAASDNYTRGGTLTLNTTTIGASVSTTTSNYAKMKLYGLLITKSALSDAQRIQCERLLARKSGVIL